MKTMNTKRKKQLLLLVRSYIIFFLSMSFVLSCCMILFLHLIGTSMNITYTEEGIGKAAMYTFWNVVWLSFVFTVMDIVRRKYTVERPIRKIVIAAKKIMSGDFSVRIEQENFIEKMNSFDVITEYFNQMAQELSGVETLRTDFISNVSHELKTPLAVIGNYGTMLQAENLTDENRIEYAKAITESARRLADLITNILKLNKLENQQIFPEKKIYDLGEQLRLCLLNFENTWEKKKIEINTDIEDGVLIESDGELLSLIWNNLFSNALKFTERGGSVSLKLKSEDDYAVVEVSDTGCGISPETGAHIFEKFYQGDTSHAAQGNGLGLALVKRVVDIVGGDISVNSEVGKGSTFTVKIRKKTDG